MSDEILLQLQKNRDHAKQQLDLWKNELIIQQNRDDLGSWDWLHCTDYPSEKVGEWQRALDAAENEIEAHLTNKAA